jgi:uncharacterized protein YggT (Ycf19 family)
MYNWKKLNCYFIIALGVLTGVKYVSEYIDVLSGTFVPDGIRFFLFAVPVSIACAILFFISLNKKSYISSVLDIVAGLSQLLVIGFRGRTIPLYGMIMSSTIILLGVLVLLMEFFRPAKHPQLNKIIN